MQNLQKFKAEATAAAEHLKQIVPLKLFFSSWNHFSYPELQGVPQFVVAKTPTQNKQLLEFSYTKDPNTNLFLDPENPQNSGDLKLLMQAKNLEDLLQKIPWLQSKISGLTSSEEVNLSESTSNNETLFKFGDLLPFHISTYYDRVLGVRFVSSDYHGTFLTIWDDQDAVLQNGERLKAEQIKQCQSLEDLIELSPHLANLISDEILYAADDELLMKESIGVSRWQKAIDELLTAGEDGQKEYSKKWSQLAEILSSKFSILLPFNLRREAVEKDKYGLQRGAQKKIYFCGRQKDLFMIEVWLNHQKRPVISINFFMSIQSRQIIDAHDFEQLMRCNTMEDLFELFPNLGTVISDAILQDEIQPNTARINESKEEDDDLDYLSTAWEETDVKLYRQQIEARNKLRHMLPFDTYVVDRNSIMADDPEDSVFGQEEICHIYWKFDEDAQKYQIVFRTEEPNFRDGKIRQYSEISAEDILVAHDLSDIIDKSPALAQKLADLILALPLKGEKEEEEEDITESHRSHNDDEKEEIDAVAAHIADILPWRTEITRRVIASGYDDDLTFRQYYLYMDRSFATSDNNCRATVVLDSSANDVRFFFGDSHYAPHIEISFWDALDCKNLSDVLKFAGDDSYNEISQKLSDLLLSSECPLKEGKIVRSAVKHYPFRLPYTKQMQKVAEHLISLFPDELEFDIQNEEREELLIVSCVSAPTSLFGSRVGDILFNCFDGRLEIFEPYHKVLTHSDTVKILQIKTLDELFEFIPEFTGTLSTMILGQ